MTPLRNLLAICLAALAMAGSAAADPASDVRAAEALVRNQIAAFSADDGERAFSFAAPEIRQKFGNAASFMQMVRKSYPAVYRPISLRFQPASFPDPQSADVMLQAVEVTDANGGYWVANYQIERQPDGEWRIAGCALRRLMGRAT
ncbi:MAG: hypothetical protein RIS59_1066 [Pseudomonadota bacterium]|jgi:hypothetical protein